MEENKKSMGTNNDENQEMSEIDHIKEQERITNFIFVGVLCYIGVIICVIVNLFYFFWTGQKIHLLEESYSEIVIGLSILINLYLSAKAYSLFKELPDKIHKVSDIALPESLFVLSELLFIFSLLA